METQDCLMGYMQENLLVIPLDFADLWASEYDFLPYTQISFFKPHLVLIWHEKGVWVDKNSVYTPKQVRNSPKNAKNMT